MEPDPAADRMLVAASILLETLEHEIPEIPPPSPAFKVELMAMCMSLEEYVGSEHRPALHLVEGSGAQGPPPTG